MAKPLKDSAIQRQVLLERLKAGEFRSINALFKELEKIIGNLSLPKNRRALRRFMAKATKQVKGAFTDQMIFLVEDLEPIAGLYAATEATDIGLSFTEEVAALSSPTAKQAFKFAKTLPMSHSGETLKQFLDNYTRGETTRVMGAVQRAFFQGKTNQELVREIVGTRAARFQDGILAISRRNAQAITHTAIQHAASAGRMATWEQNTDVVDGYEWVSTLDGRTSHQCRSLDGQEFKVGEGPIPPIHVRCRSTTVAVLAKEFDFLSEGRTRASKGGPVSAKQSYYDWLKTQPESFQVQALGPERAKLFQDGGMTSTKFSELQLDKNFQPLTLDEMKAHEPGAFEKAGLG